MCVCVCLGGIGVVECVCEIVCGGEGVSICVCVRERESVCECI